MTEQNKDFLGEIVGFGKSYVGQSKAGRDKVSFYASEEKIAQFIAEINKVSANGTQPIRFELHTGPGKDGTGKSSFILVKPSGDGAKPAAGAGQFVPKNPAPTQAGTAAMAASTLNTNLGK